MSLYEALAILALVGVGGYAYYLYRQDTRPEQPGGPPREVPKGRRMFDRMLRESTGDSIGAGTPDKK